MKKMALQSKSQAPMNPRFLARIHLNLDLESSKVVIFVSNVYTCLKGIWYLQYKEIVLYEAIFFLAIFVNIESLPFWINNIFISKHFNCSSSRKLHILNSWVKFNASDTKCILTLPIVKIIFCCNSADSLLLHIQYCANIFNFHFFNDLKKTLFTNYFVASFSLLMLSYHELSCNWLKPLKIIKIVTLYCFIE